MSEGFVVLYRNRATSEIIVDAIDDITTIFESCDCRLIYAQAISNVDAVRKEITVVKVDDELSDINAQIADLIDQAQWISNAHHLRSFSPHDRRIHSQTSNQYNTPDDNR